VAVGNYAAGDVQSEKSLETEKPEQTVNSA